MGSSMVEAIVLNDYYFVYHIVSLPVVLYSTLVTANNYIKFDKFYIPKELETNFIECNFMLFSNEGDLIEFSHNIATNLDITSTLNNIPLKMLKNLLGRQEATGVTVSSSASSL